MKRIRRYEWILWIVSIIFSVIIMMAAPEIRLNIFIGMMILAVVICFLCEMLQYTHKKRGRR